MIDVWLSVFRSKCAIRKNVCVIWKFLNTTYSVVVRQQKKKKQQSSSLVLTAFSRKAFLEFKSCLRGRWPLPGGAMWAGKELGGGRRRSWSRRITMSLEARTGCGCTGRRKWLMGGRVVLQLGCARGLSMKKHMCPCKQDRRWSPSSKSSKLSPPENQTSHLLLWTNTLHPTAEANSL